ncbi:DNA binding protein [Microbacterium phage Cece]|nr:DNA binding protein [Microbacterium phage Cece]
MTRDTARLEQYAQKIEPLLPLAKRAYGSRDTVSPQHDASREYTRLLVEFYNDGEGSLVDMAKRLGVQYAGVRRRVVNKDVPASSHRSRKKFPDEVYEAAVKQILEAKEQGTYEYHLMLFNQWQAGLSMTKIAERMGLSSANPLYYGVNKIKKDANRGTMGG